MLILNRKSDERIVFLLSDGRQITILVTSVRGKNVKVGIEAPKDVLILREELQKRRPQCEAISLSNGHKTDGEK
ncbi:carbon storage regulator [Thermogutta sp.]|jgi:carbon storage regulator CsrA|uniref:carbon storage regulator n=1 Tax=Thermogutta sp. TaxID=1962930 RepID=UPI00321FED90